MKSKTNVSLNVKTRIPFDALFREYYPEKCQSNGMALCPWHDDTSPSLSLKRNAGLCHGACANGSGKPKAYSVVDLHMLKQGSDFKAAVNALSERAGIPPKSSKPKKERSITRDWPLGIPNGVYDYVDESGRLVFQVGRFTTKEGKTFRQRQPFPEKGAGWYANDLDGVQPVVYHLPTLKDAQEIIIVEGEKDVHSLEDLGFIATCNPMGAGKWQQILVNGTCPEVLRDKRIIIIPDNDSPGRKHATQIADFLVGHAASVKILDLLGVWSELPEKGDVSDLIRHVGTEEAKQLLIGLFAEAPEYIRQTPPPEHQDLLLEKLDELFEKFGTGHKPPLTDSGNALRLAARYGRDIRRCAALGWMVWDGRRWARDLQDLVQGMAKETAKKFLIEAAKENDDQQRDALVRFALKTQNASRIEAMIELFKSEPGISLLHDDFDRDKMRLNVMNGTIDLRTGELCPHKREDRITMLAPVEYDPEADCPRWKRFILDVTDDNEGLAQYLQVLFGYAITGTPIEQVWALCSGKCRNGKSTLFNVIRRLLGDYAQMTGSTTFMDNKYKTNTNDLAALRGARIVISGEPKGKCFDSEALKQFTGGEAVRCRFLYREEFEYQPEATVFIFTNERPMVTDHSDGFWRRVHMILFKRQFMGAERDKNIETKLLAEGPGILNWLVQGCLKWQETGLDPPQEIISAVEEYQRETDILGDFLETHCIIGHGMKITVASLFDAYEGFCTQTSIRRRLSRRVFNQNLDLRFGIAQGQDGQNRVRTWFGIGLRADVVDDTRVGNEEIVPHYQPSITTVEEEPQAEQGDFLGETEDDGCDPCLYSTNCPHPIEDRSAATCPDYEAL